MLQLNFTRIFPSLYRLGDEAAYVYLPDGKEESADALALWKQGGAFVYLRHNTKEAADLLCRFMGRLIRYPQILFLENDGPMIRHWNMFGWQIDNGRMAQPGILSLHGFEIVMAANLAVQATAEGLSMKCVRLGGGWRAESREAVFSWDGQLKFQIDAEPGKWGDGAGVWADVSLFWNQERRSAITYPAGTKVRIMNFQPINMASLRYYFVKGAEGWRLMPFGTGYFEGNGNGRMGRKGIFKIGQGDRAELLIEHGEPSGAGQACTGESAMKIHAPFYGAGIELEITSSLPILQGRGAAGEREAEQLSYQRIRESGTFVRHSGIRLYSGGFQACMYEDELLWFRLFGSGDVPGVAICRPEKALAMTFASDEFFAVLDAGNTGAFAIPYTIDGSRLLEAEQEGYPARECACLKSRFPQGQTFLSELSFQKAIEDAKCSDTDILRQACHHFRVRAGQREFFFSPDSWKEKGIVLAIKRGRTFSLEELISDAGSWNFLPEDREAAAAALEEAGEKLQRTEWESVFTSADWEGALVLKIEESGFLILPAGEDQAAFIN